MLAVAASKGSFPDPVAPPAAPDDPQRSLFDS
jgi:hypothetical protein